MPGFRYCSWCNGKGCMCCDAEQKKFHEKALASAPKWREPDIRDIRDAVVEAELLRGWQPGLAVDEHGRIDALTPDEVEKAFQPALDAEYARQFPNGPQPIFEAKLDNPDDMALLKSFASPAALNEMFADGGSPESVAEMLARAEAARLTQAARQALCPNESDRIGE